MDALRKILQKEDTILFVGSGISQWSDLPSWSGLIEQLAEFVEQAGGNSSLIRSEANRGDLLQAASYGFDKLTKQQIGEFIRSACRYGSAKPHLIHKTIVSLGPRCFITTNYDDLIEQSLRHWQPDKFFPPPITSRHLTETARIVQAREIDFVFKPHGDASDTESIILTREQYRTLLPQGERHAALDALKVLLASRPVVYLGFGLRDPDFMYVREILANTYRGSIRDHYAVVADAIQEEVDYWRRQYGIHLVSYPTKEQEGGKRDHTEALRLLDSLSQRGPPETRGQFSPDSPETVLALARYAAGLLAFTPANPELDIRVNSLRNSKRILSLRDWDKFNDSPVGKFLEAGPPRAVLVGLPGSGKSYGIRATVARMAQAFHDACLLEVGASLTRIPIIVDLKQYRGDLKGLVANTLPKSLPLAEILNHFKVKIFLDAFNEMPREYLESGAHEADFSNFFGEIGGAEVIIGSRTVDGLRHLDLPTYELDQISERTLHSELRRHNIDIDGRFDREVLGLLRRPFFFRYVANGTVTIPRDGHPREIYEGIFSQLKASFEFRFGAYFDIEESLARIAYGAMNDGEEAFPLAKFLQAMGASLRQNNIASADASDVANWLISSSILNPHTSGRIAFIHQSITEYLASKELADRFRIDRSILREKIRYTRWDQSLFFTLSLLPEPWSNMFLRDVLDADMMLALRCSKYLEHDREEVVSQLLLEVTRRARVPTGSNHAIAWAISNDIPVSRKHEDLLWSIAHGGDMLGAAAVERLVEIGGSSAKARLLSLLLGKADDYNLCANGIGPALRPLATIEDARVIAEHAASLGAPSKEEIEERYGGFVAGSGVMLRLLDTKSLARAFIPSESNSCIPTVCASILCHLLMDTTDVANRRIKPGDMELAGELLLRGAPDAPFALHMLARWAPRDAKSSWDGIEKQHIEALVDGLQDPGSWSLSALRDICQHRPDLSTMVGDFALAASGVRKAALKSCQTSPNSEEVFELIGGLINLGGEKRQREPLHLLKEMDLDWSGRESLLLQLLRLRDYTLTRSIFGGSDHPNLKNLGKIELGTIDWWLEWIDEASQMEGKDAWLCEQLACFVAEYGRKEDQEAIVSIFNLPHSKFRKVIGTLILPRMTHVTTDIFSDDAISFALAELKRPRTRIPFRGTLLGNTATERFVIERLMPLLPSASDEFSANLRQVLREAGERHGTRYILGTL